MIASSRFCNREPSVVRRIERGDQFPSLFNSLASLRPSRLSFTVDVRVGCMEIELGSTNFRSSVSIRGDVFFLFEERRGEERRRGRGRGFVVVVNLLVIRGLGWQTLASFPLFAIFARWIVLRSPRRDPKRKSKISLSIESSVTRKRTLAPLSPFNEPRLNFEERRGRGRREKKEKEEKRRMTVPSFRFHDLHSA